MTSPELQVQRSATLAFIAADPITVTLTPRVRTLTNGVAKWVTDTPRVPQVMKLIMQSPAGGSIEQHTAQGTARRIDFTLLGAYDSLGAIGDYWEDADGTHWEITAVIPDNGYERRFTVEANGTKPTGG
jgi:hypothetical protein